MRRTIVIACTLFLSGTGVLPAQNGPVYRVPVTGTIELGLAPFVARALAEARDAGAQAVILDLDTPGGRVDAAQRIVKAIIESDVPVYAYVNTHAWSAGAMIALAADSIFMVPGSSIGAATPVGGTGEKAPEKIVSAMRAEFRALAERRGIDPRIAMAMVDEEIAVEGISEQGSLLTLTASEAVDIGFSTAVVEHWSDLMIRLDLARAEVVHPGPNWAEAIVRFLSHPLVAPILLSLGVLGLMIEIKTPSFGIAGAVGLISLGAFFGSHLLIGLAGYEVLILLGVGMVALAIEVFVVPGFGLAGVVAIMSIGAAIFMSLIGSLPTWNDIARAGGIMMMSTLIIVATTYSLVRRLPSSDRWRGILLRMGVDRAGGYISAPHRPELVGQEGVALTDLRPTGVMALGTERLDVVCEAGFVERGTRLRIIRSEGYRHVVLPVDG